ncbi:multiple sugar transport system permease protein [Propionicimonas paludicola]|uniref:Multiple sugar transport system permease protein n=1 Tax=Propionicimonas paludicola TaxID=185243 RepID=A0A2A9CQG9_9ACTN|nr:sugar ABC transporter permease [Propionicimonas paludicola]PFG15789.1 multiple sugar transport system permease protein [Propionicimonas paludicola]
MDPALPPARRRSPLTWVRGGGPTTLLFALPMIVIFGVFSVWPILRSVVMAFQETNLTGTAKWVGLDNFAWVLSDPDLPLAIGNTAYFALLALVFGFPIPLIGAVLMSEVKRLKGFFTTLAYLPAVIPPVVSVLLWRFFYDGAPTGVFNQLLGWIGLGPFPWLNDRWWAMPSLVLEATWAGAGGTVIIYLAALVGVPGELYEAAELDGAGIWRKIWHVTLPQLRGVLFITLILQLIATAQVFLEPYLFTGGGPNKATLTILLMIYNYAFGASLGSDYGAATALSMMLAAFLAIFSLIYFRLTRSWSQS